ncbi:sugar phosphate nucleotidyltransferase [Bailinhaonella thermotolerans]|uniref:NDP-sugar synthase n=1 Tax=Bailinhaonella thermotolerans TaxID=1070861 RepID=A0A3A4AZ31_9ACTN|nr:NDP-sugar synthase [Bailinhaonella thermotolerans]RJL30490.1 NDP-sugar synthase [Bailinhaonella thermotolerans]
MDKPVPGAAPASDSASASAPPSAEAILLVGGQGTRLRPLTVTTPKPLLPTAGVPFLAHQLTRARRFGVRHVVFATCYQASMFEEAFGDGSAFGLTLSYVTEDEPLGTGGAIRNAAGRLTCGPADPVLVLNGDILSGHDIAAQLALHRERDAAVTLHLTEVEDPSRFGCVPIDGDGKVTAFLEKTPNPVTNRINAGCYVFRRSVIDEIPYGQVVSVERETFPGLIEGGATVLGYADSTYWLDVGTPEAYVKGSRDVVLGHLGDPGKESLALEGASVAADAKVSGGTVVGRRAVIGPGAVVEGSVIFDDAVIEEGVVVVDSVVGAGVRVGAGTVLRGAVLGDGADVGPRNELLAGARVWPEVKLPPGSVRFSSDV